MSKGEHTRNAILDAALQAASELGLEAVTIGHLAKATGMSKSGLFAHFQSKENLQLAVLEYAGQLFTQHVVRPALQVPGGIARIQTLVDRWVSWEGRLSGGCLFVSASTDFKDRPGKVRDLLIDQQRKWIDSLQRMAQAAIRAGDFRPECDCAQFSFELYSLLLGFHLYHKLLQDSEIKKRQQTALKQLMTNYR